MRTAIIALTFIFFGASADAQVPKRQIDQQRRIGGGAIGGELTKEETAKLERQQGRIRRQTRRDRLDDGKFTAAERAKANRKLNRASRQIYKEKHDAERREQ